MKQTAVEWLFEQLCSEKLSWNKDSNGKLFFDKITSDILQQAKAIEEEQHQETFKQSRLAKIFEKDMPPVWESWEKYYKETFKSE